MRPQLVQARSRRRSLFDSSATTCCRLVQGTADGCPGFTLDRFAQVGVLSFYDAFDAAQEARLFDDLVDVFGLSTLYVKRRPKEARTVLQRPLDALAPETPARGPPVPELTVLENGASFLIRPGQGLSVGLYLDMRDTRRWLNEQAQGRTVLNCFAYTCGFGIAAQKGGAARCLNLDLSRKVLDWGAENARLNGFPVEPRDYLAGDVFDWLARLHKKGERFDTVVLDPPSFAQRKKGVFSAATDYAELAAAAARVVSPGGTLLACCNLAKLAPAAFAARVREGLAAAERHGVSEVPLQASPVDFPSPPGEPGPLKVLACQLDG